MGDEKHEDVLTDRERHALGHAHSTQHFGTVQILILKTHYTQQYLTHSKKLFLIEPIHSRFHVRAAVKLHPHMANDTCSAVTKKIICQGANLK